MPFPNEHACDLGSGPYDRYARKNCEQKHNGKCIDVLYGIKNNKAEISSLRYPKKIWDAGAARAHCKSRKGRFAAASGRTTMDIYIKSEGQYVKKELSQEDYLNWFKSNTDDEGNVTEDCMLYKDTGLEVNTDKSVTFVMSDDSLDRDFERFDTSGWDLKAFKKNNVLLWGHQRDRPAIGTVEKTRTNREGQLLGDPKFDEDDPFAVLVGNKVDKRIIKAGSVGFFPSKVEIPEDEKDPCKLIYKKQELREFSICNVPANPNAVIIEDGKSADYVQVGEPLKGIVTFTNEEMEQIKDDIAEMKIDIENLKDMQIKMAGNIAKDDRNYYEELLKTKKSQPKDSKKSLTETILRK